MLYGSLIISIVHVIVKQLNQLLDKQNYWIEKTRVDGINVDGNVRGKKIKSKNYQWVVNV